MNGSQPGVSERVRALEVMTAERQAEHLRRRDRIEERLEEGAERMDELGASAMRQEMALSGLAGLPARMTAIEAAVSPLPSLMKTLEGRMGELHKQWEPVRNKLYYAATVGIGYLWATGKLSTEQAGHLAKALLGPLLGF